LTTQPAKPRTGDASFGSQALTEFVELDQAVR
jgi:hypothetical protein